MATKRERFIPRMRTLREAADVSIRHLATKSGVDRTKISRWERGEGTRMIRDAIAVAREMGKTVEQVFEKE